MDRGGGELDVSRGHPFADFNADRGREDFLGGGTCDPRVIHLGQPKIAHRPAAAKEILILENGILIQRLGDIPRAGGQALDIERFDEPVTRAAQPVGRDAEHVEPVGTESAGLDFVGNHAGRAFDTASEHFTEMIATTANIMHPAKLRGSNGGLEFAHAVAGREKIGGMASGDAVVAFVAAGLETGAEFMVAGSDHASVATANVLEVVERKASDLTDCAHGCATILRAPCLGAVFDQRQVVLARDGVKRVEVAGISRQVNRKNRARARGDSLLDAFRIEVVRMRIEVGETGTPC